MADASSRIPSASSGVGATYRVVGFVGQRATRSGALDGYRIWARDAADVVPSSPGRPHRREPVSDRRPTRRPAPPTRDDRPGPHGSTIEPSAIDGHRDRAGDPARRDRATDRRPGRARPRSRSCCRRARARRRSGRGSASRAGSGVAYGAPRLRADRLERRRAARAVPRTDRPARRARPRRTNGGSSGQRPVTSVHKLGDRWRAELVVGSRTRWSSSASPAPGSPARRSSRAASRRSIGIVRRPYPTATDRRFAVTPRFPADVRRGRRHGRGRGSGAARRHDRRRGRRPGGAAARAGRARRPTRPHDADLVDLAALVGRRRAGRRPRRRPPARRVHARRRHGDRPDRRCAAPRSSCWP